MLLYQLKGVNKINRDEFNKWLDQQTELDDMLILIGYKYKHEKNFTYSIEYLSVDFNSPTNFTWLNDWDEGQEEVVYLGFIEVDKIPLFIFNSLYRG